MADLDEDVIPTTGAPAEDVDLSDEVQDFRFLSIVSRDDAKIPRRGEKDFEPHNTNLQMSILDSSRQAMADALSFQRVHQPKKSNLAVYHPASNMAYIDAPKSTLFKSMGVVYSPKNDPLNDSAPNSNRVWLLPEEILYLIERGTVDCRWPATDDQERQDLGLPMSVQGAHAVFIGLSEQHNDGLDYERFSVYSYLKRAGYSVHRAATWAGPEPELDAGTFPPHPAESWLSTLGLSAASWRRWLASPSPSQGAVKGPLAGARLYRSYADIYRHLSLIPFHDPRTHRPSSQSNTSLLRITYNVWKPSNATYRKSRPGPPDFRIAVVDARESTLPTLAELAGILDTLPYAPPQPGGQLHGRLRHGYKSVILAVVDQGVTSFIRLADAAFGLERLYDRPARVGNKGGGQRGKGRGQGGKR